MVALALFPSARNRRMLILLELKIMLFGFRPELNFLHDDLFLMLFGLMRPFALLVLELAVVHDPAHRRIRSGSHLDKVQFLRLGKGKGLLPGS